MSERTAIQARNLTKRYGGIVAVDRVNFALSANEVVCIIGPNGAGKSSLVAMLSGATVPSAGDIIVDGQAMEGRCTERFCQLGVVRKFQGTNTFQWLSARDNLAVARLGTARWRSGSEESIESTLDLVGLGCQADTLAGELSHGQRQWLELGMTLISRPTALLLDEPTAGMTADETLRMAEMVGTIRGRCAVVVIEHDMGFVRDLRCRTLVMHQGSIIREGAFDDIANDREIQDIYLGRGGQRAQG
ncbi:ATP-binding cassette domain-containing protein [Bradyrhizobium sp. ISRA443]|uniref:ATP-binding cassette domain-containing protein n=1 Tax=unclassified Bradyrhizobium TaxID=2631580 RepID=UPI002478E2F9|nr:MULTISPECIES: ATP-binding cassette domain-containing protein [unclassified Bradyrhizobium]WGR93000.1 ATP-binding cassette domain-containing protein [Bradyrhizobium sp. ISRA435]WGR97492.1 ATP-binding cassette domain-containing protein [Bradyrhizobium sp. ISRA436]WGS04382.1 ATP-binding cassette domain-containing protein [Bradyrhizobium sp. ISRA437]WGS11264.1 ATP-binding cassette domain-containing protein [Bradyrhizobium sp. ISRA443]